jgi:hypothetical protein
MIKGVAMSGSLTDAYQGFAYRPSKNNGGLGVSCGAWPSPTNTTVDSVFTYLSVARFHPQNFSSVRMWVSAGGRDRAATDNPTYWPYLQINDTFLNSTCLSATAYGEPANCTTPFLTLHAASHASYVYRFVYEPQGTHLLSQLDARDMFVFFQGRETGGCYTSTFPPVVLTACG